MAEPAAGAAVPARAAAGAGARRAQQAGFKQTVVGIVRMAVFWYFAMKFFGPKRGPASSEPPRLMSNLFHKGEPLDMWLYLSEQEKFNDFGNEDALVWHEANVPYAIWGPASARSYSFKYFPSEAVKHNGSVYAHVFFARSGYPPDPNDPEYQPQSAFGRSHSVVTYLPKPKADKRKSLLGNSKGSREEEPLHEDDTHAEAMNEGPVEWVSYWKPNVTINLVDDFTRYPHNAVPPNVAGCIHEP